MIVVGSILIILGIVIFFKVGKITSTPSVFRPMLFRNSIVLFLCMVTPVIMIIGGLMINIYRKPLIGLVQLALFIVTYYWLKSNGSDLKVAKKIFELYFLQKRVNPMQEEIVILSNTISVFRQAYSSNRTMSIELSRIERSDFNEIEDVKDLVGNILEITNPLISLEESWPVDPFQVSPMQRKIIKKSIKRMNDIDAAYNIVISRQK